MEQNENPESPGRRHGPSGRNWWEEWDGQDSSVPDEPDEPEDDGLPSPHCAPGERTWVEAELARRASGEPPKHSLPGEELAPSAVEGLPPEPAGQPAPDHDLPPEAAEARRRQGLTGLPRRTGTGFFYRKGDEIPPTHPDHGPMHLLPRQQDGSFAAYYYCSKAELVDAADHRAAAAPPRRDGFSPERQEQFVEHVRGGASGREAARQGSPASRRPPPTISTTAPTPPAFRAAVDEAARVTDDRPRGTAFDRAVNGQEEIVYHKGQRVGVRWK